MLAHVGACGEEDGAHAAAPEEAFDAIGAHGAPAPALLQRGVCRAAVFVGRGERRGAACECVGEGIRVVAQEVGVEEGVAGGVGGEHGPEVAREVGVGAREAAHEGRARLGVEVGGGVEEGLQAGEAVGSGHGVVGRGTETEGRKSTETEGSGSAGR